MIKSLASLIIVFFLGFNSSDAVDLFGYYEGQYFGVQLKERFLQLQSNKLRVDLAGSSSDAASFGANFTFLDFNGQTVFNVLDYLPKAVADDVHPDSVDNYVFQYADSLYLDNAFVRLSFSRFDLTVGRQQISYGTGYAWNPTDVFNIKDVLDPTYEQPGRNGVRLDWHIGGRFGAVGVYAPSENWARSTRLLRFKGGWSRFDFSLSGGVMNRMSTDYHSFKVKRDRRTLFGFDTVGELLGLGCWFEGAYNGLEKGDNYLQALAGVDYTLDNGIYLMSEWFYNEAGKTGAEDYTLTDWMRFISGESLAIGRLNALLLASKQVSGEVVLAISAVYSASDRSLVGVPQMIYNPFQDVEVTVFGNLYYGQAESAFGEESGSGGIVRVRVYF